MTTEQFIDDLEIEIRPAAFECDGSSECEICHERGEVSDVS